MDNFDKNKTLEELVASKLFLTKGDDGSLQFTTAGAILFCCAGIVIASEFCKFIVDCVKSHDDSK